MSPETALEIRQLLAVEGSRSAAGGGALLSVLHRIQARYGRIPLEAVPEIARALHIPEGHVYSVATFYPAFSIPGPSRTSSEPEAEDAMPGCRDGAHVQAGLLAHPPSPMEKRFVLERCGRVDPRNLDACVAQGAYEGLRRALEMGQESVLEAVRQSGLRGRGGAGFPTGDKWKSAKDAASTERYVVCNGAEGDPGAFMDRVILEGDPHAILEGMAIAALAVGASRGFLYLRAEYEDLVPLLEHAIADARGKGFLGQQILGSSLSFEAEVFLAAGRYVCGEESALLASMEGRRGNPRLRPPYPTRAGLHGAPTVVNNVKTLVSVPPILRHGAASFAGLGQGRSRGTAILALSGAVARPGVVEVPMGTPLRIVVEELAGGVAGGRALKAVQTGGPMGGVIPAALLDVPVTFEAMDEVGSPLGSGGVIVLAEGTCMVATARFFAEFASHESCGYCAPCRLGTDRIAGLLADICEGRGRVEDLDHLLSLGAALRHGSFCAFGQGAPKVVLSTLRHYRHEFEQHVRTGRCPQGQCTERGLARS